MTAVGVLEFYRQKLNWKGMEIVFFVQLMFLIDIGEGDVTTRQVVPLVTLP